MNKFTSNAGPKIDGVLLCGPSCIGKSSFHATHKFYKYHSKYPNINNDPDHYLLDIDRYKATYNDVPKTYCIQVSKIGRVNEYWEILSHANIITKKAIILGAPYKIWKERIKKRLVNGDKRLEGRLFALSCLTEPCTGVENLPPAGITIYDGHVEEKRDKFKGLLPYFFHNKFEEMYVKWIKKMNKYNIPYILVDNRNDYPILDESSFMTMLQDEPI